MILNARLEGGMLSRHARLEDRGAELMRRACEGGLLSVRGQRRVLRVARTIADLNGSERVRARDLGSALALRSEPSAIARRVA
jgi:magnesium chelatase family protein